MDGIIRIRSAYELRPCAIATMTNRSVGDSDHVAVVPDIIQRVEEDLGGLPANTDGACGSFTFRELRPGSRVDSIDSEVYCISIVCLEC
jgi:hypothetical protein